MSPVQSSPSLQSCLSGASELPSATCHHHSQQQHTHPVTVARINWWPLTGVEVAAVLSLDTFLACLVCKSQITPTTERLGRCASAMLFKHLNTVRNSGVLSSPFFHNTQCFWHLQNHRFRSVKAFSLTLFGNGCCLVLFITWKK